MKKEFSVKGIDSFQTIDKFIWENFPEGCAAFPQYGNSSQMKTERFTTVPFIMMNGSMQWKVPIKNATMGEFLKTFEILKTLHTFDRSACFGCISCHLVKRQLYSFRVCGNFSDYAKTCKGAFTGFRISEKNL